MLSRGEQRAMIIVSLLLILSLGVRITVAVMPAREPSGMEQFLEESRRIIAVLEDADSLKKVPQSSRSYPSRVRQSTRPGVRLNIPINAADSADLLPLPGIGPVFAGRIIRYRNMLGGYVHTDQLSEVYGLSLETIQLIAPQIQVDTSSIRKLYINKSSFRDLLKHPYLEYEDVIVLMNFMESEGSIATYEELWENHILPDSILLRIRPYLNYSH